MVNRMTRKGFSLGSHAAMLLACVLLPTAACMGLDDQPERAESPATAEQRAADALKALNSRWDDKVGLWFGSTTRGPQGHDIRANAANLVRAANDGVFAKVDYERVLANLRKAQAPEGATRFNNGSDNVRGNFWWAWEDKVVTDPNSGFFTTVQLLALHHEHRDQLSDPARADLDHMLAEAVPWFRHKVYPMTEEKMRYPNAYFGDAVCLWLLCELQGAVDAKLTGDFHSIVRYYLDRDWGWGEHLSDMYSKILQRELVALLIWQRELPPVVEKDVRTMMTELCQINAWFDGGPTVPAIRNYWIEKSPGTREDRSLWFRPYIELMRPETVGEFGIAALGYKHGLHRDFQIPPRQSPEVTVDTYDGHKAYAWVDERWRLGVQSSYPFFADMQTKAGYGTGWHAMPVAFWHRDGDWAYLQWAVEEDGKIHAHPAMDKQQAGKEKLCRLSDRDMKATLATTRGIRAGRQFLAVRELPHIARSWAWASDRLRVVAGTHAEPKTDELRGWHRLALPYAQETLTVAYRPLTGNPDVVLERKDGQLFWGPHVRFSEAAPRAPMLGLWFLSVDTAAVTPPVVEGTGVVRKIILEAGHVLALDAGRPSPWSDSPSPTSARNGE